MEITGVKPFSYEHRGAWWYIYDAKGVKVDMQPYDKDEAREIVYKLNGWGVPKPILNK